MTTLVELIDDAKYAPLYGNVTALRDVLNARPLIAYDNPDGQETVVSLPSSILAFLGIATAEEKAALLGTFWRDVAIRQYAAHEAAVDAVNAWVETTGALGVPLDQLIAIIINAKQTALILPLLTVLAADGILSAETMTALQAALLVPDPSWQATIYEYGDSAATAAGLPYVSEYDVRVALKELGYGLQN